MDSLLFFLHILSNCYLLTSRKLKFQKFQMTFLDFVLEEKKGIKLFKMKLTGLS